MGKGKKFVSKINYSQNPIWNEEFKSEQEFFYKDLPDNYLQFKLRSSKNQKKIGELNISLYLICESPIHFDLCLSKEKRVLMDIYMSQYLDLNIKTRQINAEMITSLKAVQYFHQLSLI